MRLHAFHVGGERADIAEFDPLEQPGLGIEIPYFAYLIQHPQGDVVFDTGVHPELLHKPEARLGANAGLYDFALREGDDVTSQLAVTGVDAGRVGHVVLSHLHYDHAGGIDQFHGAEVYVQGAELAFAFSSECSPDLYVRADFDGDLRWRELDGEHDLFGDGRIVCVPTPGHSPGHQSLLVRLESQTIMLLADATYRLQRMRERALPPNVWDATAMVASWDNIEQRERSECAKLICTHDLDWATRVRLAPSQWYQ